MANREIRVRLDRTASESDVGALREWLAREQPLYVWASRGELAIEKRERTDVEPGSPMGFGDEIVVALIGAGASALFKELLQAVRYAVEAWRDNRRDVEDGEPPGVDVDGVDPDAR
ncbi:hypothetical protein [Streptomyces cylindrosporus]|uniref:Uncharacterized protein n=1 Tax=Streptomyces cylindrosporus TaxID=2927583 RepID=A0ABS9YG25_9ACTN|nr:hypothetical protein [Streptomyces cylindrosporus]MCI3274831.1 hypothetical protein [Streptomyces cylindrosporus]